jgi:hypothetical protein
MFPKIKHSGRFRPETKTSSGCRLAGLSGVCENHDLYSYIHGPRDFLSRRLFQTFRENGILFCMWNTCPLIKLG